MMPRPGTLLALGLLAACAAPQQATWSTVRPPEAYLETLPTAAVISVNGVEVGRSPLAFPVPDAAKRYAIRAAAPGFDPLDVTLEGSKLAGTRLDLVLRPAGFGTQRQLVADDPLGLLQAAMALLRADRPRDALAFAQASLAAGNTAQAHRVAGEAYRRLGDRNRAIQEYSIYLTDAPDAPDRKAVEAAIAAARKDIDMTQPRQGLE